MSSLKAQNTVIRSEGCKLGRSYACLIYLSQDVTESSRDLGDSDNNLNPHQRFPGVVLGKVQPYVMDYGSHEWEMLCAHLLMWGNGSGYLGSSLGRPSRALTC